MHNNYGISGSLHLINYTLEKCHFCNTDLRLDQKSIRHKNQWVHADCLKENTTRSDQKNPPQMIFSDKKTPQCTPYKAVILSEQTYHITNIPQMKKPTPSLVVETVNTSEPAVTSLPPAKQKPTSPKVIQYKEAKPLPQRSGADPVLVVLAMAIFGLLFYTAYSMFSYLSFISIGLAAVLSFYQILSRKNPKSQYSYRTRTASAYSIIIMILPFVFGGVMQFDGYLGAMSIIQVLFVWMLTLSFWQTMLFVPLAIRSIAKESLLEEPKVYPKMSVIVPAYNEDKVIRTTIEALIHAD